MVLGSSPNERRCAWSLRNSLNERLWIRLPPCQAMPTNGHSRRSKDYMAPNLSSGTREDRM